MNKRSFLKAAAVGACAIAATEMVSSGSLTDLEMDILELADPERVCTHVWNDDAQSGIMRLLESLMSRGLTEIHFVNGDTRLFHRTPLGTRVLRSQRPGVKKVDPAALGARVKDWDYDWDHNRLAAGELS